MKIQYSGGRIVELTQEEETAWETYRSELRADTEKLQGEIAIKKKLEEIDLKSIRAIREYIAALPDAPQILKDREAEAISERGKLKP